MFVDRVRVNLRAGAGGAGIVAFRPRRGKPRGKAEGGSGGHGGDVYARATEGITTLSAYARHPHAAAGNGAHGGPQLQQGRRGTDLVLEVPLGTVIRDAEGVVLADLVKEGEQALLLQGGRGGRGNAALVSSRNPSPNFCEQGEYGREGAFEFELKLVADAAIVGFPNAGKSTLISAVSAAKPKIADYPFTTLSPHLGVVTLGDRELLLADIPGLVEGAAEGKGLGREFLRHTERARALVVLLDPTQPPSITEQHRILLDELGRYSPELAERARVVAVNKIDVTDPATGELVAAAGPVLRVSAVRGDGLKALLGAIASAVDEVAREAPEREGFILHRPAPEEVTVTRDGTTWVVSGQAAERAVALSDLTDTSAAAEAARRLAALGVGDLLRAAGAELGDEVRIGGLTFEFGED